MEKNFKRFIKFNKKILDSNIKYQGYLGIADRQRTSSALLGGIMFAAYSNKLRLEPVVITDQKEGDSVRLFKSLGFRNFLIGFSYKKILSLNIFITIKTTLFFLYSLFKIININIDDFIKNYKVENIFVGDLIYDNYIRYNLAFKNPKVDFNFLKILYQAIFRVYNINLYIKRYKFSLIFVNTESYVNNNSILLRIGIQKKIKCYLLVGNQYLQKLVNFNSSNIKFSCWNLKSLGVSSKDLSNLRISVKSLNKFLNDRFSGVLTALTRTANTDLINSNSIRSISKKSLFEKLKINRSFKKIILIAPHAFSDAPHSLGVDFIFRDYYQQFLKTIEFIKSGNFKNTLWLVRPHPSSERYNEINIVKGIIERLDKTDKNIFYCPKDVVSTKDLIQICDHVITGRGTIGLEFACFGKKPLIAGASAYSGFNLALEPKNQFEYFKFIEKLNKIKTIDKTRILLAKKMLYYFEIMYPKRIKKNFIRKDQVSKIFEDKISNKANDNLFKRKTVNKLRQYDFKQDALYKFYYRSAK